MQAQEEEEAWNHQEEGALLPLEVAVVPLQQVEVGVRHRWVGVAVHLQEEAVVEPPRLK